MVHILGKVLSPSVFLLCIYHVSYLLYFSIVQVMSLRSLVLFVSAINCTQGRQTVQCLQQLNRLSNVFHINRFEDVFILTGGMLSLLAITSNTKFNLAIYFNAQYVKQHLTLW